MTLDRPIWSKDMERLAHSIFKQKTKMKAIAVDLKLETIEVLAQTLIETLIRKKLMLEKISREG